MEKSKNNTGGIYKNPKNILEKNLKYKGWYAISK